MFIFRVSFVDVLQQLDFIQTLIKVVLVVLHQTQWLNPTPVTMTKAAEGQTAKTSYTAELLAFPFWHSTDAFLYVADIS